MIVTWGLYLTVTVDVDKARLWKRGVEMYSRHAYALLFGLKYFCVDN